MIQNKQKEIAFFDSFSEAEYNVFTDKANQKIINTVMVLGGYQQGDDVADLGCGSGVFTELLQKRGLNLTGVDLSAVLTRYAKHQTSLPYIQGDVEFLPFKDESLDGVVLSCLLHHLPDPTACIREVKRVLKPGGRFVGFDPNRFNPFMYLYRDRSSPFYSPKGVTENERPVVPKKLLSLFKQEGFKGGQSEFVSGLSYRYVASPVMRKILPVYNFLDDLLFKLAVLKQFRVFVFTYGEK